MSVYRALQATRFLLSLTGAAPYSLSRSSIKFSRVGFLWPFIQLPVYACHLYFNRARVPTNNLEIKTLLVTSWSWFQLIFGLYGVLKDGLCQKNIIQVVRLMDIYDKRSGYADKENGRRENERIRSWTFAYSAVIVILTVCRVFIWRSIRQFYIMEFLTLEIDNGIHMFAVLTTLLGFRVRHLNSLAGETGLTNVQQKGIAQDTFYPPSPEHFRELYTRLVAIGERINDHYSDRLFLWTANNMLACLAIIYLTITENVSTLFIGAKFLQLFLIVLGSLICCMACQFTIGQANKIVAALLMKNIRHTARINQGRREIFTMGLYMALRPLEFSALGFFSVDGNLIFTIVATTTAYITLCVQTGGA